MLNDLQIDVALQRFAVGEALTDEEVKSLAKRFKRVTDDLFSLTTFFDPGFGLAHKTALSNLQRLESYKTARTWS